MRKQKDKSENVSVLSLTIPSIESLVVAIQKLRRDIIRGTKTPISKLTVTYQPSPQGPAFMPRSQKYTPRLNMTMSHWDGTPPREVTQGRKEYIPYIHPPVPTNDDIRE